MACSLPMAHALNKTRSAAIILCVLLDSSGPSRSIWLVLAIQSDVQARKSCMFRSVASEFHEKYISAYNWEIDPTILCQFEAVQLLVNRTESMNARSFKNFCISIFRFTTRGACQLG